MFVFAVAAPALFVVLVGYVVGYAVVAWVDDLLGDALSPQAPEVVGWVTGLVLLGVVVRALVRRRRRVVSGRAVGHQK
jgi:threonine/homoserine/homoserine lactone efflux protein